MEIERFETFAAHEIHRRAVCRVNKGRPCTPMFSDSACVECMNRHYQNLADAEMGDPSADKMQS